jgi:hypothetical protein
MSSLAPGQFNRGIPEPGPSIEELQDTVAALQEIVETLIRQRGKVETSAVTVADLVKLGLVSAEEARKVVR